MKDENGIEICCENCRHFEYCDDKFFPDVAEGGECCNFETSNKVLEARIAELQEELEIIKEPSEPSESFYQKYSGVSEEYALGALEQCATEADELQAKIEELENKLTETVKLLSERSRECGELEAKVKILKAFVLKVHTSPVIFEDVNRALRDEAKTLWGKLNQSAESEEK